MAPTIASVNSKLDNLMAEIIDLKSLVAAKDESINSLKNEVDKLNKEVSKLRNLVDEEDAYVRRDTVILSGTSIPEVAPGEICSNIARELFKEKLKLSVDCNEISAAHRLGSKRQAQGSDKRPIVVKFCRRDMKRQILFTKSDNSNRNATLWTNESLTPKRRTIMYALRKIKRENPECMTGCNTLEGHCFAYTKTPRSVPKSRVHDRKHVVNTHEALVEFCRDVIKKPLDDYLDAWNH